MTQYDAIGNEITIDPSTIKMFFRIPHVPVVEGEKWVKHVRCEGARFHVLSYSHDRGKVVVSCNEPDCIYNKPEDEE